MRNSREVFSPFFRFSCVDYLTLWRLNVLFFSLFVSVEPAHCEFEDDFFSVFHTQISPENYENCMQNMKTGMFNLCDHIGCHKRMLAVYGNSHG